MPKGLKIVQVKNEKRISMISVLDKNFVRIYVDENGDILPVSMGFVFEPEINDCRKEMETCKSFSLLFLYYELWKCEYDEEIARPEKLFKELSGLSEKGSSSETGLFSYDRVSYDEQEWEAILTGKATRIWPNTVFDPEIKEFRITGFREFSKKLDAPKGTILARNIRLTEKVT